MAYPRNKLHFIPLRRHLPERLSKQKAEQLWKKASQQKLKLAGWVLLWFDAVC